MKKNRERRAGESVGGSEDLSGMWLLSRLSVNDQIEYLWGERRECDAKSSKEYKTDSVAGTGSSLCIDTE